MSRQRGDEFTEGELRILQRTAVEHALTARRGPTGLELAGALERLRSDRSDRGDEQPSATADDPTRGVGLAVPLTALAVVSASEFGGTNGDESGDRGGNGSDATDPRVSESPWRPGLGPGATESDPSPAVVGAAVACCRFEVPLARAASAVGRTPEAVARTARSLGLE
ncbi:MAG: hypothetical protein ABEI99_05550 [Halobaculum sp.]